MILIKRTSAWDELSELVDRDEDLETSSPYFKLYNAILETEKWDALDNVVSDEFPNGVEQDELEDFFKDEQDFILDQLFQSQTMMGMKMNTKTKRMMRIERVMT